MVVPQTPLHTARVLQEDKDHWDEVKVGALVLSLPAGFRVLEKGLQGGGFLRSQVFRPRPMPGAQTAPVGSTRGTQNMGLHCPLQGGAPGSLPHQSGALVIAHLTIHNIWESAQPGFRLSGGQV